MKDLVVAAADRNIEFALRGLLSRHKALGIRQVAADIFVLPGRDPECALKGVSFLGPFSTQYAHALLVFDHEGSGKESEDPQVLEQSLKAGLAASGWSDRAEAIVLVPELESWVWSDSPHVDSVVGWKRDPMSLREWLAANGLLEAGRVKPERPKEAFEAALAKAGTPRSSSLYRALAESVSVNRCTDPAFANLRAVLVKWFGV